MKRTNTTQWKAWIRPEDLPQDLRLAIHQGGFKPLMIPEEANELRRTVLEVFAEVLEIYIEDHELRWRCDHVHRARPEMPMEGVFQAIAVELGVSVPRLRAIWFTSRRKARVKDLICAREAKVTP